MNVRGMLLLAAVEILCQMMDCLPRYQCCRYHCDVEQNGGERGKITLQQGEAIAGQVSNERVVQSSYCCLSKELI